MNSLPMDAANAPRALHWVNGFYDRVGNLIRNRLIREDDILPTVGGFAIAVWLAAIRQHRLEILEEEGVLAPVAARMSAAAGTVLADDVADAGGKAPGRSGCRGHTGRQQATERPEDQGRGAR
jgi:hypothetical protein